MALIPLQQADPQRYEALMKAVPQTQATLNETNAAAGAAGASAANSMSEVAIHQHELAQQQLLKDTQAYFDKNKDKTGHVSPEVYNQTKQAATALGIDGNSFDSTFGKGGYVDPTQIINYNTAEGQANQAAYAQVKRQLQDRIDQYNQITPDQKGFWSKAQLDQIPLFGALLAPHAYTYDNSKDSFAAQLKGIAGGGQGTGLRINEAELEKWAKLLPSAADTSTVAKDKLKQLDGAIKATFNVPSGLDPQYTSSSNRPSLSSFMK
jgi:hypothetical protein